MKKIAKKSAFILLAVSMLQLSVVSAAFAKNTLKPGETLAKGQMLQSADGRFALVMQQDGNLVHYMSGNGLWDTNTDNKSFELYYDYFLQKPVYVYPDKLVLNTNGVLQLKDLRDTHVFWTADTAGWMRQHYGSMGVPVPTGLVGDTLYVQDDGNVTLYDTKSSSWQPVWATNTYGH
ncbi:hypothetical protein [Brevibacillus dissolubilis]|uniref:hypothetical protein n=1 Tax=Brevibacillus dissolubilis TaxID=1844116 RepID=UPI001115F36D|nr:hypothetical protein [Brevibacillus dissolubilis]